MKIWQSGHASSRAEQRSGWFSEKGDRREATCRYDCEQSGGGECTTDVQDLV